MATISETVMAAFACGGVVFFIFCFVPLSMLRTRTKREEEKKGHLLPITVKHNAHCPNPSLSHCLTYISLFQPQSFHISPPFQHHHHHPTPLPSPFPSLPIYIYPNPPCLARHKTCTPPFSARGPISDRSGRCSR